MDTFLNLNLFNQMTFKYSFILAPSTLMLNEEKTRIMKLRGESWENCVRPLLKSEISLTETD